MDNNTSGAYTNPDRIDTNRLFIEGWTGTSVSVPFELGAKDFLNFAEEDLKEKTIRNTVNALSNIKRAIDCLCDSLLYVMNYIKKSKAERWNFPQKTMFLGEIGIIAPDILKKINSMRNLLEHEFRRPDRTEVELAFDVANLFYYATNRFTKQLITSIEVIEEDGELDLEIEINVEQKKITIQPYEKGRSVGSVFVVDENHEDYKKWMRIFFELQY